MEGTVIEVGGSKQWPGGVLSNFSPHEFIFEGIKCSSMEGFLQSLKFPSVEEQLLVCKLIGKEAKKAGIQQNKFWQSRQKLWWQGQEFPRESLEFQSLLDRAFNALAINEHFLTALLATGNAILKHSIGNSNPKETILTEEEFCSRLTKIRESILTSKQPPG